VALPATGLGVILLSAAASSGTDELPPPGKFRYAIIRGGDDIGWDEIELTRDGSRYKMTARLNIAVRLYGITIRRLENTMSEEWVDGRLQSFASSTDEDGARRELRIEPGGGELIERGDGFERRLPADASPGTFWRPVTASTTQLIDPVSGKLRRVQVTDLGRQTIMVRGQSLTARHFSISGKKMNREIWYGPDGTVVHFEIRNPNDPVVVGELR
jgi:hypothetical protein